MSMAPVDVSRLVSVLLPVLAFIPSALLIREGRMTFGQALMYHVWLLHTLAFGVYTFVSLSLGVVAPISMDDATLWSSLLRNHGVIMAAGYALLLLLERRDWKERGG